MWQDGRIVAVVVEWEFGGLYAPVTGGLAFAVVAHP